MEYFTEELDRSIGELRRVSQGHWITVTELGETYGYGKKEVRFVLAKMELLQTEGAAHSRYRLAPWAVEQGLGKRIERKGAIPFDTISPEGQAWVAERWGDAIQTLEDAKSVPVRKAEDAIEHFRSQRNAYRASLGQDEMSTKEMVYWVVDHFPNLSQPEVALVVKVTQPLVNRILMDRKRHLEELWAFRRHVPK